MGGNRALASMTNNAGSDVFLYPTNFMFEHERAVQKVF
jgi:hypothetical protein